MAGSQIFFRSRSLQDQLERTGNKAGTEARIAVERYFCLMELSLPRFPKNEALAIAAALNGCKMSPETIPYLWRDALYSLKEDGLAEKWGIGEGFIDRIKSLSPVEWFAIALAVERFWYEPDSYQVEDVTKKLKDVGLLEILGS